MELRATAKINLGLDVLRKREDGYHEVRMVMQMTGMYDQITLHPVLGRGGISIKTNHAFVPENESNLAYKAAKLLMDEFGVSDGLDIRLKKFIPVAAGLAGGSADAAAVLCGVNELFSLGLTREELMERGQRIGADVPYCVLGGTALAEGIGERLSPLSDMPPCGILLAKPPVFVSTKEVYGALKVGGIKKRPDIDGIVEALRKKDLRELAPLLGNVLEEVTAPMHPVIRKMEEDMESGGALRAIMSGSGPSVFGLFDDYEAARKCRDAMKVKYSSARIFLTEPYARRK